mgnify:CR=1 FL=1
MIADVARPIPGAVRLENNRVDRLSVDHLGNQVVALIGLGCDRLEQSALITFGYRVPT